MKIGLACGGTGGHIFPGLATAEALTRRGHEVVLWMAGKDVEQEAVKGWQGDVITVPSKGLPGGLSLKSIGAVWALLQAGKTCRRLMKSNRPDVLLGMGSYACAGPVMAALRLKVPVVLHEANVLPGKAISFFSRRAAGVAGSFEETRFYLNRKDIVVTGMPLRSALEAHHSEETVREDRPFTILVMGGSRGAKRINEVCTEAIPSLVKQGFEIAVIHLAGRDDADSVRASYTSTGVPNTVHAFAHDMAEIYRSADLAICRSGASTCAEISVFGVPSLLVPYPYAARDHQMANARSMEKVGAADVVAESELSAEWLKEYIEGCIHNPERLSRLSESARSRTVGKPSEALADFVEKIARRAGGGA